MKEMNEDAKRVVKLLITTVKPEEVGSLIDELSNLRNKSKKLEEPDLTDTCSFVARNYSDKESLDLIELIKRKIKKELEEKDHSFYETARLIAVLEFFTDNKEEESIYKGNTKLKICCKVFIALYSVYDYSKAFEYISYLDIL